MGTDTAAFFRARIEQSAIPATIANLNRLVPPPFGIRAVAGVGVWELEAIDDQLAFIVGPEGLSLSLSSGLWVLGSCTRWRQFIADRARRVSHRSLVSQLVPVLSAFPVLWAPDYFHDMVSEGLSFDAFLQEAERLHGPPAPIEALDAESTPRLAASLPSHFLDSPFRAGGA